MGGNFKSLIFVMALPLVASCSNKQMTTAQNLDYNLDTASGTAVEVTSPAAVVASPEATKIAMQCESKANSSKQSGNTDAAAQGIYYSCLQSAFNITE